MTVQKITYPDVLTTDWIPLEEIQDIPDNITNLHCDTRDFCMTGSTEEFYNSSKAEDRKFCAFIRKEIKKNSEVLINKDEIIPLLRNLEEWSGRKADWRFLSFIEGPENISGSWFKYIRFYRIKRTDYFVITCRNEYKSEGLVDYKKVFTKENINQEHLHTH